MRLTARLLLVCLSLFGLSALAAPVSDLYQVREAVSSQQPEERAAALSRALDTLVLRLTGKADAAQSPALKALRKDPQQIVSQYGYEGDTLLVDFDPLSTDRQLRQAGLALWGANRPSILLWWLSDASEGSHLIGDGQAAAASLNQAAQHRGLPLRLPLADLSEQLLAVPETSPQMIPPPCVRLLSVTPPMPCWPLWRAKPMANGKPSGGCGWAMSVSRGRCRAPIRPHWPMPSCWRSTSVWRHVLLSLPVPQAI
jgi:hypothetical protein